MPLPHRGSLQVLSQPSPSRWLPSSHCSPGSTTPLPHTVNAASTRVEASTSVTVHGPVPLHAPDHPANVECNGTAVRWTCVPHANTSRQSRPQEIPRGFEVTVPSPSPRCATVRRHIRLNRASTRVAASSVTTQAPSPLHPPPRQPTKRDPAAGVAVNA